MQVPGGNYSYYYLQHTHRQAHTKTDIHATWRKTPLSNCVRDMRTDDYRVQTNRQADKETKPVIE